MNYILIAFFILFIATGHPVTRELVNFFVYNKDGYLGKEKHKIVEAIIKQSKQQTISAGDDIRKSIYPGFPTGCDTRPVF